VLNVGGNSKTIALPKQYTGWRQEWLDIDPKVTPDILCDARELHTLEPSQYDAVYCSHNLEHYYWHEVPTVIQGFVHVLKPDGFAKIRVPDVYAAVKAAISRQLDIDDILYTAKAGDVSVRDVMYGYQPEIRDSGEDFFAHKNGFTARTLSRVLKGNGFSVVALASDEKAFEIKALAFKMPPSDEMKQLFDLRG
jgi:SAM-dependent methyltransferase